MARVSRDPYTWHSSTLGDAGTPGMIYDGKDELGNPAKFRLVKHVNAVTVVAGHCAVVAVAPSAGVFTVTNDVSGGSVTPLAGPIGAGIYCCVPAENEYCFILVEGYHGSALGDGSVAAGEMVTAKAADGTFDTASSTLLTVGVCLVSDTGSPTTFPGLFKFC